MSPPSGGIDDQVLRVRRGKVDSVDLYEIKDHELDQLESGSPGDVQLNWGVFLLSLAFGSVTTLSTVEKFSHPLAQNAFLFMAILGIFGGAYLVNEWRRLRKSTKKLCKKIRERLVEAAPEAAPAASADVAVQVEVAEADGAAGAVRATVGLRRKRIHDTNRM